MANMRARVELRGCLTHTARGRTVERGRPFYTTNPADIAYYKSCGEYAVTILESEPAKPAKAKPARPAAPPPPPDDEGGEGEDGGDEDEGESEDLTDAHYTKADLEKMTKPDLATLADEDFGLKLNPDNMNKPKMIGVILKAQIDKHKG